MIDSKVYFNIIQVLRPLLQRDFPGCLLGRSSQLKIQGTPSNPVVFFEKINDNRYGFPRTDFKLDVADGEDPQLIPATTVQVIQTKMQFSALAPQTPENEGTMPSAADVLRRVSMYLSANATIAMLRARGLNVQRIPDVRTPHFSNDHDQFQLNPSLDVIFQHDETLVNDIRAIDAYEAEVHRV